MTVPVLFSRVQYARLLSLRFTPPRAFTGKAWSSAAPQGAGGKALQLGAALSVTSEARSKRNPVHDVYSRFSPDRQFEVNLVHYIYGRTLCLKHIP